MIRHSILLKTKRNINNEQIDNAIKKFLDLKNQLPGIMTIMGGKCRFNENNIQYTANDLFSHSISIDFKDQRDLDNFFENPITHAAKGAILDITEGGYEGIIGFEIVSH